MWCRADTDANCVVVCTNHCTEMLKFFCKTEQNQNISLTGNSLCGHNWLSIQNWRISTLYVLVVLQDCITQMPSSNNFQRQCPGNKYITVYYITKLREAVWPSGLGCWIWNLEVPGSNPSPYRYLDLFSVVLSSTPRLRCVNSHLVSLPPVGILNSLCSFVIFGYLFTVLPISTTLPNTIDT